MSLPAWAPDEVIPAAKLNGPVDVLNAFVDNGLTWASMFRRNHLQKLAVSSPQNGFYLYNTITDKPQMYINGRWYEFQLARADYDVSGQVTNTLGGAAIAGVAITVNGNQTTSTDGSGNYSITDIPKGASITIAGALSGYNSYSGTFDISSGNATKNFTMARRTITGNVTSSAGGVIVGATVEIASPYRTATTDASGNYSLIDVPDGTYTITASHTDHSAYTSGSVVVSANRTFDFQMAILTGTVGGTVTSSVTGAVVTGASVTIDGQAAVTTNSSGVYSRTNVPRVSGTSVAATKAGYFSSYSSTVNVNSSSVTKDFTMVPIAVDTLPFGGLSWSNSIMGPGGGLTIIAAKITTSKTLQATAIQIWNDDGFNSASGEVRIYNSSGTLMTSESFSGKAGGTFPPSSGQHTITLSSPQTLSSGQIYYIAVKLTSGGMNLSTSTGAINSHEAVTVAAEYRYAGTDVGPGSWTTTSGQIPSINVIVKE